MTVKKRASKTIKSRSTKPRRRRVNSPKPTWSRGRGAPKIFETPEALWEAACSYFEWVESNPLLEEELFHYQGEVFAEKKRKARAMTIVGLCLHLRITRQTFDNYRDKENRPEFEDVVSMIEDVIYEQKFAGAAAGLFNANIIGRELGLADKQDLNHGGQPGNPVKTEQRTVFVPVGPDDE